MCAVAHEAARDRAAHRAQSSRSRRRRGSLRPCAPPPARAFPARGRVRAAGSSALPRPASPTALRLQAATTGPDSVFGARAAGAPGPARSRPPRRAPSARSGRPAARPSAVRSDRGRASAGRGNARGTAQRRRGAPARRRARGGGRAPDRRRTDRRAHLGAALRSGRSRFERRPRSGGRTMAPRAKARAPRAGDSSAPRDRVAAAPPRSASRTGPDRPRPRGPAADSRAVASGSHLRRGACAGPRCARARRSAPSPEAPPPKPRRSAARPERPPRDGGAASQAARVASGARA